MPRSERCFNVLLGLSILSWAFLGIGTAADTRPLFVQLVISALHLCVGVLILLRAPIAQNGSLYSCMAGLPALLVSGWALRSAPPAWAPLAQLVFLLGGSLAITSFLYLGRNFAILPAIRGTVTHGPFRVIRHPAYLGELGMILSCWLAAPRVPNMVPLLAAIPLVALRILTEEQVLSNSPAYVEYSRNVRWRLIPLVW